MTDREILLHRFSRRNIKRSIGNCAKQLGISTKEYKEACARAMEEEQKKG